MENFQTGIFLIFRATHTADKTRQRNFPSPARCRMFSRRRGGGSRRTTIPKVVVNKKDMPSLKNEKKFCGKNVFLPRATFRFFLHVLILSFSLSRSRSEIRKLLYLCSIKIHNVMSNDEHDDGEGSTRRCV